MLIDGNVLCVLKNGSDTIHILLGLGFNNTPAIENEEPEHIFPFVNVCIKKSIITGDIQPVFLSANIILGLFERFSLHHFISSEITIILSVGKCLLITRSIYSFGNTLYNFILICDK